MNNIISKELKTMNRKKKEKLLKYLINLEMQDRLDNQEPVSASLQRAD